MRRNPKVILHMANGARTGRELLPEAAPHAVSRFMCAALGGELEQPG